MIDERAPLTASGSKASGGKASGGTVALEQHNGYLFWLDSRMKPALSGESVHFQVTCVRQKSIPAIHLEVVTLAL